VREEIQLGSFAALLALFRIVFADEFASLSPPMFTRLYSRSVLHLLISPGYSSGARLRLMARFLGVRCHCGQVAVTHRKIRGYRQTGRFTERESGLLLPRADKPPVGPLCVHHLLSFLEERLGKGIKARFWEDRLRWPRNTTRCRCRPCHGVKSNGSACAAPAMKGSLYCQAHQPGRTDRYGLQPWLHGKRCKVTALSTGLRCKRAAMRGYTVCASHGGKAGEASKAIMSARYDPAAAMERQAKRARHRVYTERRASGQVPKPVQESWARFDRRLDREQYAERRRMEWRGGMTAQARPTVRVSRSTLFGGTVEEEVPRRPLRPLYPA
jgi:hypothetical protein